MTKSAALSVSETEESFKWPSLSAATMHTELKQQLHQWGMHIGRSEPAATGHYFAFLSTALEKQALSHWSPRPNVSAFVSLARGLMSEGCYEVQIPAVTWKIGDFLPGDLIAYSPNTLWIGDPLQCEDVGNEFAIEQIERYFQLLNPDEVRHFLCKHPGISDVIIEALDPLNTSFTEITQLVLEVFRDPEDRDGSELVCSIITRLEPHQALEKLDKFDESWFLHQTDRTQGLLNFRIDFA